MLSIRAKEDQKKEAMSYSSGHYFDLRVPPKIVIYTAGTFDPPSVCLRRQNTALVMRA
jgi:hypothetical protein